MSSRLLYLGLSLCLMGASIPGAYAGTSEAIGALAGGLANLQNSKGKLSAQDAAAVQGFVGMMNRGQSMRMGGMQIPDGLLNGCPLLSQLPVGAAPKNSTDAKADVKTDTKTDASQATVAKTQCKYLDPDQRAAATAEIESLNTFLEDSPLIQGKSERACNKADLEDKLNKLKEVSPGSCTDVKTNLSGIKALADEANSPVDQCTAALGSAIQSIEQQKELRKADLAQKKDALKTQGQEALDQAKQIDDQIKSLQETRLGLMKAGDAGTGSKGSFAAMKTQFKSKLEAIHADYAAAAENVTLGCVSEQMARLSEKTGPYGTVALQRKRSAQLNALATNFAKDAAGIHFFRGNNTLVTQGSTDSYARRVVRELRTDYATGKLGDLSGYNLIGSEVGSGLNEDAIVACVAREMKKSDATKASKQALVDGVNALKPQMEEFETTHAHALDMAMETLGAKTSLQVPSCASGQLDGVVADIQAGNGEPSQEWVDRATAPFDTCQKDIIGAMNRVLDGGSDIPPFEFKRSAGLEQICSSGGMDEQIPASQALGAGGSLCRNPMFQSGPIQGGSGLRNASKYLKDIVAKRSETLSIQFGRQEAAIDGEAKNIQLALSQMVNGAVVAHLDKKLKEIQAAKMAGLPEGLLKKDCSAETKVCKLVLDKELSADLSKEISTLAANHQKALDRAGKIKCADGAAVASVPDKMGQQVDCDRAWNVGQAYAMASGDYDWDNFLSIVDEALQGTTVGGQAGCWHEGTKKDGTKGTFWGPAPASTGAENR